MELLSRERVDKLDVIKHDNPGDAAACCTEMFKFWLREDRMASWTKLVRALRSPAVDQLVLADEIEEVFVTGMFCDLPVNVLVTACTLYKLVLIACLRCFLSFHVTFCYHVLIAPKTDGSKSPDANSKG